MSIDTSSIKKNITSAITGIAIKELYSGVRSQIIEYGEYGFNTTYNSAMPAIKSGYSFAYDFICENSTPLMIVAGCGAVGYCAYQNSEALVNAASTLCDWLSYIEG